MKSLKDSRRFHGGPISVRALCQLEDRSPPYSVLDVVATDGVRHFSGQISTGDVDCTWEMTLWQNGFWSVKGDFHDGGTLAGDFFFVEFLLDRNRAIGAKLEGSILNVIESRHLSLSRNGSDRWVREHWHSFEASGPSVRLHAAPAIGQLIATPLIGLAAVPFVVIVVVVIGVFGGKTETKRCDEPIDPAGRDMKACVEIVPAGE